MKGATKESLRKVKMKGRGQEKGVWGKVRDKEMEAEWVGVRTVRCIVEDWKAAHA